MFSYEKKCYFEKGFTLLELMITVVIAGILASMAAPSFTQAIDNNRMTTQINELLTTFNYARSEAIKRSLNVTVCNSNNGASCSGNWHDGWVVFVDTNSDGDVDGGETILRVHEALSGSSVIDFSGVVNYASSGLEATGAARTLTLCDSRGDSDKKGIIISATGQGRTVESGESTLASC